MRTRQPQQASTQQTIAAPQTPDQLKALHFRRGELVDQLRAVTQRREQLVPQALLSRSDPAAAREIDARIRALDQRAARLERDILQTDDAIADGVTRGLANQPEPQTFTHVPAPPPAPPGSLRPDFPPRAGILTALLVALVVWQVTWRVARARFSKVVAAGADPRIDRLQQSVDAIALEVERISENQRYVTKVVNEALPALGAGQGEPVASKQQEPTSVGRR